ALLLFIIGLDLSVRVFRRLSKTVLVTATMQIMGVTAIGFLVAKLLGFGDLESGILGVALALSSTIIAVKLFNDKRETTRLYAQITIGILLLHDVIATAAKMALAARTNEDGSLLSASILFGRGILVVFILYL